MFEKLKIVRFDKFKTKKNFLIRSWSLKANVSFYISKQNEKRENVWFFAPEQLKKYSFSEKINLLNSG